MMKKNRKSRRTSAALLAIMAGAMLGGLASLPRPVQAARPAEQNYLVSIHTANALWSGTDSDVKVRLSGTRDGVSVTGSWHLLDTSGFDDFERNDYASYRFDDQSMDVTKVEFAGVGDDWKVDWFQIFGYDRTYVNQWVKKGGKTFRNGASRIKGGSGSAEDPYLYQLKGDESWYSEAMQGEGIFINEAWDIDLGGHTIRMDDRDYAAENMFRIGGEGSLTIHNGTVDLSTAKDDHCGFLVDGGKLNLGSGLTISSDGKRDHQAVVAMAGSLVNMSSGTVIRGCTGINGGGVYLDEWSTMNMNGGIIEDCSADDMGGGVYVGDPGVLNVNGGEIRNCSANDGGGIYVGGKAELQNCSLTGNLAYDQGGAVCYNGDVCVSSLNLGGAVTVTGNTAGGEGSGMYLNMRNDRVYLSGKVQIYGNTGDNLTMNSNYDAMLQVSRLNEDSLIYATVKGGSGSITRDFVENIDGRMMAGYTSRFICEDTYHVYASGSKLRLSQMEPAHQVTVNYVDQNGNILRTEDLGRHYQGEVGIQFTCSLKGNEEFLRWEIADNQASVNLTTTADPTVLDWNFTDPTVFMIMPDHDVTLNAVCSKNSCMVIFDPNTGSGRTRCENVPVGSTYTLPNCTFTNDFGAFDHWEIDGVAYWPGDQITVDNDVRVLAVWNDTQCVILLDANYEGGAVEAQVVYQGSVFRLPAPGYFDAPAAGVRFSCWEVNGQLFIPGNIFRVEGDVTIKALWIYPETETEAETEAETEEEMPVGDDIIIPEETEALEEMIDLAVKE